MSRTVREEIRYLDRLLLKLVGLTNDPQAGELADQLLDKRLLLMDQRDHGFAVNDRRRVRP
jgi:hypothetical protein